MNAFIEYLLNNGWITADQLQDAVLEQKLLEMDLKPKPFTQILLEKGYLKCSALNQALDAFRNETPAPQKALSKVSSEVLEDPSDILSAEMLESLGALVQRIGAADSDLTSESVKDHLREALYFLHSLCGMARFSDLAPIERLLSDAETAVQRYIKSEPSPEALAGLARKLTKLMSLLERARPHFEKLRELPKVSAQAERVVHAEDPLWGNGSPSVQ